MTCNAVRIYPNTMTAYYKISPPRHAEKAYQPNQGDQFPTLSIVPTTAGGSGQIILLVTTLFNRENDNFRVAEAQLIDYDLLVQYAGGTFPSPEVAQKIIANYPAVVVSHCKLTTPFGANIYFRPHGRVTVRVLTGGMKAKALSLEDFVGAGFKAL